MPLVKGDADQVQTNFENSVVGKVTKFIYCTWMQYSIKNAPRYNVAQLEQWARDQKIEDTGSRVIDTLLPIIQVGDDF